MITLEEENFHWKVNFAHFDNGYLLNLNSAYHYIFRNISMIAYMVEIQKSKIAYIYFHEFDQSESGC